MVEVGEGQRRKEGEKMCVLGGVGGRNQSHLQEGLLHVGTKAGNLACAAHLDAEGRVGAAKAGEGEHGRLDSDVVVVCVANG